MSRTKKRTNDLCDIVAFRRIDVYLIGCQSYFCETQERVLSRYLFPIPDPDTPEFDKFVTLVRQDMGVTRESNRHTAKLPRLLDLLIVQEEYAQQTQNHAWPESTLNRLAVKEVLKKSLQSVRERDRVSDKLLTLFFDKGLTLDEIAARTQQSNRNLSRLLRKLAFTSAKWLVETEAAAREQVIKELPHVWLPPRSREPVVGQELFIETLFKMLCDDAQATAVLLTGLGGIGKTCVAIETAHRLKDALQFDGYLWVTWDSLSAEPTFELLVRELVRRTGHLHDLEAPHAQRVETLRTVLARNPVLLIIDGIEAMTDLNALLTGMQLVIADTPTRILYTSRPSQEFVDAVTIELPPLKKDATVPFLATCLNVDSYDPLLLRRVGDVAQGHPFALKMLAAVIRTTPDAELIEELRNGTHGDIQKLYQNLFLNRWHTSVPAARQLWLALLLVSPGGVDAALLRGIIGDSVRFEQGVNSLQPMSLIRLRVSSDYTHQYEYHSLTRAFAASRLRKKLPEDALLLEAFSAQIQNSLTTIAARRSKIPSVPFEMDRPHMMQTVARGIENHQTARETILFLLQSMVTIQRSGYMDDVLPLIGLALEVKAGQEPRLAYNLHYFAASFYAERHQMKSARFHQNEALRIAFREEEDDRMVAGVKTLAARLYFDSNDMEAALKHAKEALVIKQSHEDFLKEKEDVRVMRLLASFNLLARIQTERGEFAAAQEQIEEALAVASEPADRLTVFANAIRLARYQKDMRPADVWLQRAREIVAEEQQPPQFIGLWVEMIRMSLDFGEDGLQTAVALLSEMEVVRKEHSLSPYSEMLIESATGFVQVRRKEYALAIERIGRILKNWSEQMETLLRCELLLHYALALHNRHETDEAGRQYNLIAKHAATQLYGIEHLLNLPVFRVLRRKKNKLELPAPLDL